MGVTWDSCPCQRARVSVVSVRVRVRMYRPDTEHRNKNEWINQAINQSQVEVIAEGLCWQWSNVPRKGDRFDLLAGVNRIRGD